jgi:hypothetical protein
MYFLDFKKKFGISLLPQAYNNIKLGELMSVIFGSPPVVIFITSSAIRPLFQKQWCKRLLEFKLTVLTYTPC